MTVALSTALAQFDLDEPAVLVTVAKALGSTPREAGARMLVTEYDIAGTIGGGQLEWRAVEAARELLAEGGTARRLNLPLGPALQQCCGGYVAVTLEAVTPAVRARLADEIAESLSRLSLVALYDFLFTKGVLSIFG